MGNFNKDRRSGGGGFGNRGGFGGGGGFGGRNNDRPRLFQATCSDCGQDCEVPFRPLPGKSVYCNNCFKKDENAGGRPGKDFGGKRDFGKRDFGAKRDFGRSNFEERQMFPATCAECGGGCEVPFRPTGEKPVYCSECFGESKGGNRESRKPESSGGASSGQFEELNKKLDKILKVLEIISGKKEFIIEKPKKEAAPAAPENEEKVAKFVAPKEAPKTAKPKKDKKSPVAKKKGKA